MPPQIPSSHSSNNEGVRIGMKPRIYHKRKNTVPVFDDEGSYGSPIYYDDGLILHEYQKNGPKTENEVLLDLTKGFTTDEPPPEVVVRGEEVGIVVVVLLLWIGAIALFFNRWGKIRMLEPYQPKFCETHRPSCAIADVPPIPHFPRTISKFNVSSDASPHFAKCNYNNYNYHMVGSSAPGYSGTNFTSTLASGLTSSQVPSSSYANNPLATSPNRHYFPSPHHRMRQNSVFSPALPLNCYLKNTSRKTKSAVDLSNLVLTEELIENVRRNSKNSITQV